jgi:transposase InsO family protein
LTIVCRFIEAEAKSFPVKEMCAVLGVSKTSYYRMLKPPEGDKAEESLRESVRESFFRHSRRYGSRRLEVELKSQGVELGRHRIRRLMKEEGLWAIQRRRFVPRTTQSSHRLGYTENLLRGVKLPPENPNEVIVGDITYLPLQDGSFAYLATWADLFSRLVIGWEVEETMGESLILTAFEKGLRRRGNLCGAIVHSDRGGQYASGMFRALLSASGCRQSMSRAGETYDNAYAESLFSRYKAELLEGGAFSDVEEARMETFNYMEGYYKRIRRHSSLGYDSPEGYEQKYVQERARQVNEIVDKKKAKGVKAKTL